MFKMDENLITELERAKAVVRECAERLQALADKIEAERKQDGVYNR